ncbi:hypothetical protein SAMN05518872_102191 [Psychrobacillus sp. OK032]|nr:hypothetical protein SAMN05518872_102191 [Psychrobacillus sp. OK032]
MTENAYTADERGLIEMLEGLKVLDFSLYCPEIMLVSV